MTEPVSTAESLLSNQARASNAAGWISVRAHDVQTLLSTVRSLRSRLESAEQERDLMRPVVLHARRWYHSIGTDHDLGVEVPRYENLTAHSPTPTQGGTNGR